MLSFRSSTARAAHMVTPKLRASLPGSDEDELEWDAFSAAELDAVGLLFAFPDAAPMRVVLSLDVPLCAISTPAGDGDAPNSAGTIAAGVEAEIAAIHVDEPDTATSISQLRAAPESQNAVRHVLENDLLWYHPSEINEIPIPEIGHNPDAP
jgi:hypothetical protein